MGTFANDIAYVKKTLEGDTAAFDQLVKSYSQRVFQIVYRFFKEKPMVEDIAQEVFINAYTSLDTFSQKSPFGNWLAAITVRTCYHQLKKEKTRRENPESSFSSEEAALLDGFCFNQHDHGYSSSEKAIMLRDLMNKVLCQLSPKETMLLMLTEVEGNSVREVAQLMGLSLINVKVSNFRARKHALQVIKALSQQVCKKGGTGYE